ncbi:MAG: right-handed parallel beta-helix repeat-containing protein [Planctomycetota bacterium]|nr:right-handed parallel beta-helix repeat-containing protein [Planctomycetota bacterium]
MRAAFLLTFPLFATLLCTAAEEAPRGKGGLPFPVEVDEQGEPTPVGVGCRPFTTRAPAEGEKLIDQVPIVIEEPGTYLLGKDLEAEASCIAIKANDVILDLNGHTLTFGTGVRDSGESGVITYAGKRKGNVGHCAVVSPGRPDRCLDFPEAFNGWGRSQVTGLVLRNGRIVQGRGEGLQFCECVCLYGASAPELHDLIIEYHAADTTGLATGGGAKIHHVTIKSSSTKVSNRHRVLKAILPGDGSEVSFCRIEGVPHLGIYAADGAKIHHNFIRHRATATNGYGINGYHQKNVELYSNVIIAHNGRGIQVSEQADNWKVYDNYIETRETGGDFKQIHGLKLERAQNSHIHHNTVLVVSTEDGQPTPLSLGLNAGSKVVVEHNTFIALRVSKPPAFAFYAIHTNCDDDTIADNTFYSNDWAGGVGDSGAESVTFRRCAFRKLAPEDKVRMIAYKNYQKGLGKDIRFIDCFFEAGLDTKAYDFPKGASWSNDGDYAVGWSLELVARRAGKALPGVEVVVSDKDGKEAARVKTDAEGKATVELLEFHVVFDAKAKTIAVAQPGPYKVAVRQIDGKPVDFAATVAPTEPLALELDVDSPSATPKPRKLEWPAEPEERPFWRERAEWALKKSK